MTVEKLIAVLEGMDQNRNVISKVEPGKNVRGVGTEIINSEPVAVIR